jgi:signal transduction histidine kinase
VVGVALVAAAIGMVAFVDRSLRGGVRTGALNRAESIADALSAGAAEDVIAAGDREEEYVQVLDAAGEVVTSSPNVTGRPALARPAPGTSEILKTVPLEDPPFLLVAVSSATPDGALLVVVGRTLEDVRDATRAVAGSLAVGVPLLVLLVGLVTWRVVSRALRPVERIRAEVDAISSAELHRRVPDPPGADEIARLATTMNRMLTRLHEGQLRQRRFVSDASHELRSPVASIRQHAEVALSHPGETSLRELADVVLEEDVRLQRIVEDLLLLTRIDEGSVEVRAEPLDLDDLLFEEAARLRGSTSLRIDSSNVSAGRVLGDREKLERLVRNLTENAARHARTAVALSLRVQDHEVVLGVDDDGTGIDEAQRDRVFDRFVRLEDARDRDSGGSGLGLSIVREMAGLHGGSVRVSRSELGGARFEVSLPSLAD